MTSVFGREGGRAGKFVKRKMWTGGREHGRENRRGAKSRSGKDGKIDMVDKIICIIENELIQRILEFSDTPRSYMIKSGHRDKYLLPAPMTF